MGGPGQLPGLHRGQPGPGGVPAIRAITIAESLVAVVGIGVFRKGRWKERVV